MYTAQSGASAFQPPLTPQSSSRSKGHPQPFATFRSQSAVGSPALSSFSLPSGRTAAAYTRGRSLSYFQRPLSLSLCAGAALASIDPSRPPSRERASERASPVQGYSAAAAAAASAS